MIFSQQEVKLLFPLGVTLHQSGVKWEIEKILHSRISKEVLLVEIKEIKWRVEFKEEARACC